MNIILLRELVKQALNEDIGFGDRTTEAIIAPEAEANGTLLVKQAGVIAGLGVVREVFDQVDRDVRFTPSVQDGDEVNQGQVIAQLQGRTRSILTGERVALNYLQRMSGIASVTQQAAQEVAPYGAHIVDTRKTTPGLRMLEKYAVQVGGGFNHRLRLDDGILIKDNHIAAAGSMTKAVQKVREYIGHMVQIEVETENIEQVQEAVKNNVDVILLDNMSIELLREAVSIIPETITTEASGGLQLGGLAAVAQTGVNVLSLGWLTHSTPAMDISLNIEGSVKS